jgi:hypothetical protein
VAGVSVEKLQALQHGFLISGLLGAGLVLVGLTRLFLSRFVAAWRLISEIKNDTTGGIHPVNPDMWDLAESVEPVRDMGQAVDE